MTRQKQLKQQYEGQTFDLKHGYTATIIEYIDSNHVTIEWSDGIISKTTKHNLQNKQVKHPNWSRFEWKTGQKCTDLIGQQFEQKNGYLVTIIDVLNFGDITIQWSDGVQSTARLDRIKDKRIKHPNWSKSQWFSNNKTKDRYQVGDTLPAKNGFTIKIIKKTSTKVHLQWSDGTPQILSISAIYNQQFAHPNWRKGEWEKGQKYEDLINSYMFDIIGLPIRITDIKILADIEIQYATNKCKRVNYNAFTKTNCLPPSIISRNQNNKRRLHGNIWDIKILNIAYILNDITYLTCENADGNRYITSVPNLYEEKTGKPYPYDEFHQHLKNT